MASTLPVRRRLIRSVGQEIEPTMNAIKPLLDDPFVIDRLLFTLGLGAPALIVLLISRPAVAIPLGALVMWGAMILSGLFPPGRAHEDAQLIAQVFVVFGWLVGLIYTTALFTIRWALLFMVRLVLGARPKPRP